jgi:hypothetical protein
MTRVGNELRTSVGQEQPPPLLQLTAGPPTLTADEELLLHTIVACNPGGTAAQLVARSGLTKAQVASSLQHLRMQGLVTSLNTVVESYAAHFPAIMMAARLSPELAANLGKDQDVNF